jgi:hypothetical protein
MRRDDDARCFPASRAPQLAQEALHRLIAPGKAVFRDQVLPDRVAIASQGQALFDEFSVRFTAMAGFDGIRFLQKRGSLTTTPAAFR